MNERTAGGLFLESGQRALKRGRGAGVAEDGMKGRRGGDGKEEADVEDEEKSEDRVHEAAKKKATIA